MDARERMASAIFSECAGPDGQRKVFKTFLGEKPSQSGASLIARRLCDDRLSQSVKRSIWRGRRAQLLVRQRQHFGDSLRDDWNLDKRGMAFAGDDDPRRNANAIAGETSERESLSAD